MRNIGYYWCYKENWKIYFFDGFNYSLNEEYFLEDDFKKIDSTQIINY
jgi:hypothetical protein